MKLLCLSILISLSKALHFLWITLFTKRWFNTAEIANDVFPVFWSPIINSLCPHPTGIKQSTTLIPVKKGTLTGSLSIIPGAGISTETSSINEISSNKYDNSSKSYSL